MTAAGHDWRKTGERGNSSPYGMCARCNTAMTDRNIDSPCGVAVMDRRMREVMPEHCPETTLPPMTMSIDTEKSLRTAGRKVAEWTAERDRLVKLAVSEGGSLREVGAAAGISHTAVKFIAHGRPGSP